MTRTVGIQYWQRKEFCYCAHYWILYTSPYYYLHNGPIQINEKRERIMLMDVISGFRCEVAENCALLGHYAARSDNFLPTFQDNLSVSSSWVKNSKWLTPEDKSDRLSRNFDKKLSLLAA